MTDPTAWTDERRPNGRRSLAFDFALSLVATGVELTVVGDAELTAVVLVVAAGGVLVFRRSAPLTVLATTLAATAASVAVGAEPAGLTTGIALYTTAAICERRVSLAALVPIAAIAAGLSATTADAPGRQVSASFGATTAVLLVVGIWSLGAYAQTRRRYTRALEHRAAQVEREREQLARIAVHEERASIARELHDIVAHSVTVMLVGVRGARDVLHTAPAVADETLARVETSAEQSLAELRRILALLRSADHSPEPRPQPSLQELDVLIADHRDAGLPVHLEVRGEPRALPGGLELSVYRIVQEALTNVVKHAQATQASVTLSFLRSRLEVEIVDDGAAHASHADLTTGHGILGMRERAALLGGELETGRHVGGGYRVAAWLPVGGHA